MQKMLEVQIIESVGYLEDPGAAHWLVQLAYAYLGIPNSVTLQNVCAYIYMCIYKYIYILYVRVYM